MKATIPPQKRYRRKYDISYVCSEYIVRRRGCRDVVFIARSEWALGIGFQNCESVSQPWRLQREGKHRNRR